MTSAEVSNRRHYLTENVCTISRANQDPLSSHSPPPPTPRSRRSTSCFYTLALSGHCMAMEWYDLAGFCNWLAFPLHALPSSSTRWHVLMLHLLFIPTKQPLCSISKFSVSQNLAFVKEVCIHFDLSYHFRKSNSQTQECQCIRVQAQYCLY